MKTAETKNFDSIPGSTLKPTKGEGVRTESSSGCLEAVEWENRLGTKLRSSCFRVFLLLPRDLRGKTGGLFQETVFSKNERKRT
jgi:hypothetical protein